jgi:hypothetical protein
MPISKDFLSVELSDRPEEQFLSLGRDFVAEWAKVGVKITLSRFNDLPIFRGASKSTQLIAVNYLAFNLSLLKDMAADGESPRNTKLLLWRALKKLKFIPPSNFMEFIEDEDIVEIYLPNEIQIFRNVAFMEIVSHSLEDLLCRPWYRLGRRDWRYILSMSRMVLKWKTGLIRNITEWNVAEHRLQETDSVDNVCFSIKLKYFIPLRSQGKVAAAISTNSSRVILD